VTTGIRLATVKDAAMLAALHAESFDPGEQWSAQVIGGQMALHGTFGLLWPNLGMLLARVAADEGEILTLGVDKARRRAGVGRALLQEALVRAAALGAEKMFLEVAITNEPALGLYRASGFERVGVRHAYYEDGTDALIMRLDLAAGAVDPSAA
jgi:[ribosomal protein S18]-alanine N-acetyltransferase